MYGKPKARGIHACGMYDAWRRNMVDNPRKRKGSVELGFPGKLHAWHVDT